jgi:AraC-like DNA-binding protein
MTPRRPDRRFGSSCSFSAIGDEWQGLSVVPCTGVSLTQVPTSALTLLRYRPVQGRLTLPDVSCDLLWISGCVHVAGPLTRAVDAVGVGHEVAVLRLDPQVARQWLGLPIREITDRLVPLEHIARGHVNSVAALFESGPFSITIGAQLDAISARVDCRAWEARRRLAGGQRVASIASAIGLSERQLERLFVDATGLTLRTYARIVRFRRAVMAAGSGLRLADAAVDCGYADQSHFSREVRDLTGYTPRMLLHHVGNVQDVAAGSL